ncbi:hypothetical protein LTR78_000479 [Recurvomyces mirabilis]|uniref:Uncharacterized protein n=1 Tax=Recurvomyces mirabilis TaxID=574656 RepID=A0AAE1C6M7_9PEZI|nr:hypothetical protein LTR78_000479 [Recurvomyces mirabilis]KAK5162134.1 hypothetical protein LTS14_000480 [Recurvomyces mirabilis]
MTNIHSQHHIYASSVQFRDPFAPKPSHRHEQASTNWSSYSRPYDLARSLTPPPEMNTVSLTNKPVYHQQEHGTHCRDYAQGLQQFGAASAPYARPDVTHARSHSRGVHTQPSSRTISPVPGPQQPVFESSQSRRGSQVNAIAPSFQIPRSVNDSGGSLSELAAQITCLFWFESADILQMIEDSSTPYHLPRSLAADAKPNTGFRKWVTTILSTTLVAQNVVLLALLFIYRLKKLNPTVRGKPGSEYRLLTVALMLGNKFLDDNTYTNKTWADVSGIVVGEVHIMEVEFLSNMKYCLFTSEEDWTKWQSLLGRFAAFFERASRPQPPPPVAALLPASSFHLPMALPSPPQSTQSSPPYNPEIGPYAFPYGMAGQHGPTPLPSPFAAMPEMQPAINKTRKRSLEDSNTEPPAKRVASAYPSYSSPLAYSNGSAATTHAAQSSRLRLPSLAIPAGSAPSSTYGSMTSQAPQLPPLNAPSRAMALVYPPTSSQTSAIQLPAPLGMSAQPSSQLHSQLQSRQQSPYPGSGTASPSGIPPHSAVSLHPPIQVSPTYFLQQRNSPYRPIHNVSTLLYPPPSGALQQRPHNMEQNEMHYQPLGKSIQQRHVGHLPYVSQNVWLNGHGQQPMTPVHQWPSFMAAHQQHVPPQR